MKYLNIFITEIRKCLINSLSLYNPLHYQIGKETVYL